MKRILYILIPLLLLAGAAYEWGSGLLDASHLAVHLKLWDKPSPFTLQEVIDRQQVFEGKNVRVLINYKPLMPGHVLIIPKRQVERVEDLSNEEWGEMREAIALMHRVFQEAYHAPDYMLVVQNGLFAGQTVPHMHFHMLPRDNTSIVLVKVRLWEKFITEALRMRPPISEDEQRQEVALLKKTIGTLNDPT